MSTWLKTNNAHIATWMVEMVITDIELSFPDSPGLKMSELTSRVPGAGSGMTKVAIDAHLIAFFNLIKLYKPVWEEGATYQSGQKKIRALMADPDKTLKELADVVDSVLLFEGELEGDS